jgi:hypothetical protein
MTEQQARERFDLLFKRYEEGGHDSLTSGEREELMALYLTLEAGGKPQ